MGSAYHRHSRCDGKGKKRVVAAIALLTESAQACRKAGHDVRIVSCGGTGTLLYCVQQPGITEVQVGGAIFNDEHYRTHYNIDLPQALTSSHHRYQPPDADARDPGCGQEEHEHGCGAAPAAGHSTREKACASPPNMRRSSWKRPARPRASATVLPLVVGYSDTTVHLHEEIVATRKGAVEAVWRVAARGKIK